MGKAWAPIAAVIRNADGSGFESTRREPNAQRSATLPHGLARSDDARSKHAQVLRTTTLKRTHIGRTRTQSLHPCGERRICAPSDAAIRGGTFSTPSTKIDESTTSRSGRSTSERTGNWRALADLAPPMTTSCRSDVNRTPAHPGRPPSASNTVASQLTALATAA